ncbi:MAG TPA: FtsX-like permease family protein [Burkholderiales bacterium]|nr:FtsX-like permease family protein [Burkholderiales bacterium]
MKGIFGQALRMLLRDWRAGELRVLAAALAVAVASITSVAFFADRVSRALERDAHQLLGADLVLVSDHPWQPELKDEVRKAAAQAEAMNFVSMAFAGERNALAGVKAVSENYPLRGRLRTAPAPGAPDAPAERGPAAGTVWLEERLVSALGAPVGSRIRLGKAELQVAAVLTLEPERSANFFNIAPRLMMNVADVPATSLIQTGSRVWYYLYAAGPQQRMEVLEKNLRQKLERGQRIDNLETGRPEVRASVERARRFLGLTALLAAVLAGVAIALTARRFVERHLDGCAVMRCLGATQAKLLGLYAVEFALLGVVACLAGTLIGFVAHAGIAYSLTEVLRAELPPPGVVPAVQGFLVGLTLLLGFAVPPVMQLKNVPAVRVIRREAGAPRGGVLVAYLMGLASLTGLLIWQAGDLKLGTTVVGGFAAAVAIFFVVAWGVVRAITHRAITRRAGRRLRYGLANLRRHARGNAVQIASLALGLTAVLLLTFTRNDLIDAWRRSAPPDAPNRFLVGVQPDQVAQIRDFFTEKQIGGPELYPMIRGRLVSVNGRPVSEADYEEERAKRLVEREFNLSYMTELPSHNEVVSGRWFSPSENSLSVEEGIAKRLGWKLGDELTWTVGGERFSARISSLRKLRWDSMKVNFFVIAPPRLLEGMPTSFVSAFRIEQGREPVLNELSARFPNVTIVDVAAAVRQAQGVIDQLVTAVQFVFLFALGAGLLVLYSALVATEDERRREAAVMRVYGASRAQVTGAQRTEFLTMGLLAGVLATLAAAAIGQLLARRIFELDLAPSLALWIVGPLAGVALLALNAWLSSRKVLQASPALTLRDSV